MTGINYLAAKSRVFKYLSISLPKTERAQLHACKSIYFNYLAWQLTLST